MSSAPLDLTSFSIDPEHVEQITRGVSAVTIDPLKNVFHYFFPAVGAFFSNFHRLRVDPALEATMPGRQTEPMLREITQLTKCAGIQGEVVPYMGLTNFFSSSGGPFSVTKPLLFIPEHHLFRRGGEPPFASNKPTKKSDWVYTDDETRFFIARELAQVEENSTMVRIAAKIALLSALFSIYAASFGWLVGGAVCIGVLSLYISSERYFQGRSDELSVKILARRGIQNPTQVALSALEKMRRQNLYRRQNSLFGKIFINPQGNSLLDFMNPSLTTRISRLNLLSK